MLAGSIFVAPSGANSNNGVCVFNWQSACRVHLRGGVSVNRDSVGLDAAGYSLGFGCCWWCWLAVLGVGGATHRPNRSHPPKALRSAHVCLTHSSMHVRLHQASPLLALCVGSTGGGEEERREAAMLLLLLLLLTDGWMGHGPLHSPANDM